jgi:hypothetical protein
VFTARYATSPYIKQARFVFKGLNIVNLHSVSVCMCTCVCASPPPRPPNNFWTDALTVAQLGVRIMRVAVPHVCICCLPPVNNTNVLPPVNNTNVLDSRISIVEATPAPLNMHSCGNRSARGFEDLLRVSSCNFVFIKWEPWDDPLLQNYMWKTQCSRVRIANRTQVLKPSTQPTYTPPHVPLVWSAICRSTEVHAVKHRNMLGCV